MASYSYRTWETINLPTVNTDTYFIILDHAASGDPSSVTTGVIYSGLIMKNYGIKNLNEILSQHIYPQEISFSASGYTQLDTEMTKTFYVYYTTDDWANWTNDDITITYDWSYTSGDKTELSDPILNLIDYRQIFVYSAKASNPSGSTVIVKMNNSQIDTYNMTGTTVYNYVRRLDTITYPGEFTYAYSYDFFVDAIVSALPDQLVYGNIYALEINGKTYYITNTCYRYCLYYLNNLGGWDSLLFRGRELQSDKLNRLSYKSNYVAGSTEFFKKDYLTKINEGWTLNTSFLSDLESGKMIQVMASNRLYLHDFDNDVIIPVNITNSSCDHKTYKNQGRKMATYEITVEASQPKFRI